MSHSRAFASLLATVSLMVGCLAHADIGIQAIADQSIPSGKTLVVPIAATDPGGPARTYTVTIGTPTVSGTTTPATAAGFTAAIRTGDPHLAIGVTYTDSTNGVPTQTGTMEFQLLREFTPVTTQIIGGLAEGGFYNPKTSGTTTTYVPFHRIVPGFVIQGGDPTGTGGGGPGFSFKTEFSNALIFSGSEGQLAMANSNSNTNSGNSVTNGESNGSQFFVTLSSDRRDLDYGYTLFGQILRGYDTLTGIASTPLVTDTSTGLPTSSPVFPVDITSATVSTNDTDAVLLLSATGVCDALVTVTAVTGTASTTGTFMAHAVADTISDPPFLRPPPDITARNGIVKVPVQAADLQLDLIRYGYQRFYPFTDPVITSGTSPVLTIPLIPNSDNLIGAEVDQWERTPSIGDPNFPDGYPGSSRGFEGFPFHVGAGDKALRGSLRPIPPGHNGVLNLAKPNTVAVFTAGNPRDNAASFTATVNWGDGTLLSTSSSAVTIVRDASGLTLNRFKVLASHDFSTPGEYPVIVKIADQRGAHLTLSGTANVSASSIALSGTEVYRAGGVLTNQVLGSFEDYGAGGTAADYAASIDWGDGTISAGTIKALKGHVPTYRVMGTHTYKTPDTFTVLTTVTRTGGSGYSASTWAAAHIAGVNAPQVFPPFAQAHLAQMWSPLTSSSTSIVTDGGNPYAGLVTGTDGDLYGTTYDFGAYNAGTVFKISITGTTSVLTTLHAFTGGADGGNPYAGLLLATDGNFYGTTVTGGASGYGTVYQITASGSLATLYSFSGGADGRSPYGVLIEGTNGNLYGTTKNGGTNGVGTIFEITTTGTLTTLFSFTGGTDGGNPIAGLVTGTDGYFYGTAMTGGGIHNDGTIYRIIPGVMFTPIHAFIGSTDGANPVGGLVTGTDGNLYGTASTSGTGGAGTLYDITTSGSMNTLFSFTGGVPGGNPRAALITGTDGNLYGTTETSGTGAGTVFRLVNTGSTGMLTVLYTFTGGNDGGNPFAPLTVGSDGNLYGTTEAGGTYGAGTVYQVAMTSGSTSVETMFHPFSGNNPAGSSTTFQIAVQGSVRIVNSGNVASMPGSLAVYVDPESALDGFQTEFTTSASLAIPALKPGQSVTFNFNQVAGLIDTQLKLPVGFDPTGQFVIGVVTYDDPVADFDGSQKIVPAQASPYPF